MQAWEYVSIKDYRVSPSGVEDGSQEAPDVNTGMATLIAELTRNGWELLSVTTDEDGYPGCQLRRHIVTE